MEFERYSTNFTKSNIFQKRGELIKDFVMFPDLSSIPPARLPSSSVTQKDCYSQQPTTTTTQIITTPTPPVLPLRLPLPLSFKWGAALNLFPP